MKIYLVGGFVRDSLRGANLEDLDKDFVVVGATHEQMIEQGFKNVGASFPVYLHPETKEEYALARKEKKTSRGYHGFEFEFTPDITLEEDLLRRDFTINAIAQSINSGELTDPFDGQKDIKNKVLKHVSDHFVADPLRLVRAARFKAILGFEIHETTYKLLDQIRTSGELETLSKERILMEVKKTISRGDINIFVDTLKEVGAWMVLFNNSDIKYQVPTRPSAKNQLIYFFHSLDRELVNIYPLPNNVIKMVKCLDDFQDFLMNKNWSDILNKFDAWRVGADFFTQCLDCICDLYDEKWQYLAEMRMYVRESLDKTGLDQFQGPAYGQELENRRKVLIQQYIQANPLK